MYFRNEIAVIIRKFQKACNADTLVGGGIFFIVVDPAGSGFRSSSSIMSPKYLSMLRLKPYSLISLYYFQMFRVFFTISAF